MRRNQNEPPSERFFILPKVKRFLIHLKNVILVNIIFELFFVCYQLSVCLYLLLNFFNVRSLLSFGFVFSLFAFTPVGGGGEGEPKGSLGRDVLSRLLNPAAV